MRVLLVTTCKADDRSSLAIIRALGLAGCRVTMASDRHLGCASYSRYLDKRVTLPHPSEAPEAFLAELTAHLRKDSYDVLLPVDDYSVLGVARGEETIRELVKIPMPSKAAVERALNKYRVLELASKLGIATPKTVLATTRKELLRAIEAIGFPCLVKLNQGAGAVGMLFLDQSADIRKLESLALGRSDSVYKFEQLLVQETIAGLVHDVGILFRNSKPVASLTQKRVRMYPSRGGGGILNETTYQPELIASATKLLQTLDWEGPAQVEFMVDHSGRPRLLEINGRFWGTIDLAIQAGLNIPLMACTEKADTTSPYQVGLRYRWPLPQGLLHIATTGQGWQEFFAPSFRIHSDLRLSDPVPHLAELLFIVRRVYQRGFRPLDPRLSPPRA